VTIVDAGGADVSAGFPDVRRIGRALGSASVVLDGVIVLLDDDGLPRDDEATLSARALASESKARRLADRHPAAVMLFDLLWQEGRSVDAGYADRRARLDSLALAGPAWQTPGAHLGDGSAFAEAARQQGFLGLVSKKTNSRYRPGATSADWRAFDLAG
jgi:bifunctional non-homologous end joining protein LigD